MPAASTPQVLGFAGLACLLSGTHIEGRTWFHNHGDNPYDHEGGWHNRHHQVHGRGDNIINSCTSQNWCISWTMSEVTESEGRCHAPPFVNGVGMECVSRWKVCARVMTPNHGSNYHFCPYRKVAETCPDAYCTGGNPPFHYPTNGCGPLMAGDDYCQYGAPGETLEFRLLDDDQDCADNLGESDRLMDGEDEEAACLARVSCSVGENQACPHASCSLSRVPCVHRFTIPDGTCGCDRRKAPRPPILASQRPPIEPPQQPCYGPCRQRYEPRPLQYAPEAEPDVPRPLHYVPRPLHYVPAAQPQAPPNQGVASMPPGGAQAPPKQPVASMPPKGVVLATASMPSAGGGIPSPLALAMASGVGIALAMVAGAAAYRRTAARPSAGTLVPVEAGLSAGCEE